MEEISLCFQKLGLSAIGIGSYCLNIIMDDDLTLTHRELGTNVIISYKSENNNSSISLRVNAIDFNKIYKSSFRVDDVIKNILSALIGGKITHIQMASLQPFGKVTPYGQSIPLLR